MDNVQQGVKDALVRLLKDAYPAYDVVTDDIAKMQGDAVEHDTPDYIYIDAYASTNTTYDAVRTDYMMLVDITAHERSESRAKYLNMAVAIDRLIRPALRVGDRAVTINSAEHKIVDGQLHYAFTVRLREGGEQPDTGVTPADDLVLDLI